MGSKISVTKIYSDGPGRLSEKLAAMISEGPRRLLVLTSSKFRADRLRDMVVENLGGKTPPGTVFTTLNSFAESFPDAVLDDPRRTITLSERHAAVFGCGFASAGAPAGYELCKKIAAAISELKSNGIFYGEFVKRAGPVLGSARYAVLARAFASYERLLAAGKIRDYDDKLYEMSFSREFSSHLSRNFDAAVFDSAGRMNRLERALAVRIVASFPSAFFAFDGFAAPSGSPADGPGPLESASPAESLSFERIEGELAAQGYEAEELPDVVLPPPSSRRLFETSARSGKYLTRPLSPGAAFSGEFADRASEAESIARAIKSAASRERSSYGDFCVYVQDFEKYSRHFAAAFEKYGIPYAAIEACPMELNPDSYPVVCALKFMKSASADTFACLYFSSRPSLFDGCRGAFNFRQLKNHVLRSRVFDVPGDAQAARRSIKSYAASLKDGDVAGALLYGLEKFVTAYFALASGTFKSLSDYFAAACSFMKETGVRAGGDGRIAAHLIGELAEFSATLSRYCSRTMGFAECSSLIYSAASSAIVPPSLDPHGFSKNSPARDNVLVMSREGARFVGASHIFIAGLVDGEFPRSGPESPSYFDHRTRSLLGVEAQPPRVHRERPLFHHLVSSARKAVYLSRPASENNVELVASRFLSEVEGFDAAFPCGGDEALCASDAMAEAARREGDRTFESWVERSFGIGPGGLATIRRWNADSAEASGSRDDSFFGRFSATTGAAGVDMLKKAFKTSADLRTVVSATALERFLNCPAAFYFQRVLGLAPAERFEPEIDRVSEGAAVHAILQRFMDDPRVARLVSEYRKDPEKAGEEARAGLEKIILEKGLKIFGEFGFGRFGEFYLEMKKNQYFNGLAGFETKGGSAAPDAVGAPGYLKNFISDYILYISDNDPIPETFGTELKAETTLAVPGIPGEIKLYSECDLVELWRDPKENTAYFFVTDYKLSSVPSAPEIRKFKKIQAPFYLFVLERYLNRPRAGRGDSPAARFVPAGFVYKSVTRMSGKGLARTYFFDSSHVNGGGSAYRLVTGKRSTFFEGDEFRKQVLETVSIVSDCLAKIASGEFHQSVLEGHDCGFCDFASICRRKESTLKRIFSGDPGRNNRARLGAAK